MITTINDSSDILKTTAQTVICPVNCVGVMGKGLALACAKRYAGLLMAYRQACRSGELKINTLWVFDHESVGGNKKILCFPTKNDWRNDSRLEWIETNLKLLANEYQVLGITSLAVPKLGCGAGGLDWVEVKQLIVKYLEPLPIPVELYV